jgi:amino acid permease
MSVIQLSSSLLVGLQLQLAFMCNWHTLVLFVNFLGVRVFGEFEFWFSSIKGKDTIRFLVFLLYVTVAQSSPWLDYCSWELLSTSVSFNQHSIFFANFHSFKGGNPKHDRIGFRYWRAPNGPMGSYLLSQVKNGPLAIFLGFWATLTNALFAYIGTELIGVCSLLFAEIYLTRKYLFSGHSRRGKTNISFIARITNQLAGWESASKHSHSH